MKKPRVPCSVAGCDRPVKAKGLCMTHWQAARRPKPSDPRYFLGKQGQHAIAELLRCAGRSVEEQPPKAEFDLFVDGYRVEIKTGNPKHRAAYPEWAFNVQSNGILNERADFYIFRMEQVPGKGEVHLLFKAPLNLRGLWISERTLAEKYDFAVRNFEQFAATGAVPA